MKWDLKRELGYSKQYKLLGVLRTGEYIGNHHFGVVSHHIGFSESFLKIGAGLYQIVSGTSSWKFMKIYFDDPKDSAAISQGYKDWKRFDTDIDSIAY